MSQQKKNVKPNIKKLPELILEELENIMPEQKVKVSDLVSKHWEISDYFTRRSFDVYFCKAKSILKERGILFKRSKGIITRI